MRSRLLTIPLNKVLQQYTGYYLHSRHASYVNVQAISLLHSFDNILKEVIWILNLRL